MWHMHVIDVKDSTPFSIVLVCACFLPKTTGGVALHTLDCIVFADGYIYTTVTLFTRNRPSYASARNTSVKKLARARKWHV